MVLYVIKCDFVICVSCHPVLLPGMFLMIVFLLQCLHALPPTYLVRYVYYPLKIFDIYSVVYCSVIMKEMIRSQFCNFGFPNPPIFVNE